MKSTIIVLLAGLFMLSCQSSKDQEVEVFSPDKNISAKIFLKRLDGTESAINQLHYKVNYLGVGHQPDLL